RAAARTRRRCGVLLCGFDPRDDLRLHVGTTGQSQPQRCLLVILDARVRAGRALRLEEPGDCLPPLTAMEGDSVGKAGDVVAVARLIADAVRALGRLDDDIVRLCDPSRLLETSSEPI